jgi:CDP-diacylglycerol--glycerol-3-phosphate 3-phosphatidyltransferase
MDKKNRIMTVPNLLSLFRLFLIIPIIICLSHEEKIAALLLMVLGVATDSLDGYIARRWNQCSDIGRIADPVIDKISVLSVVLYMIMTPGKYYFPLWYFLFLLCRELLFMVSGLFLLRKNSMVIEARKPGKRSAFANSIVVILFMLNLKPYSQIVLYIALVWTVYSTYDYFKLYFPDLKQTRSKEVK